MIARIKPTLGALTAIVLTQACTAVPQHAEYSDYSGPALLTGTTPENLETLRQALASHLGQANSRLGPEDLSELPFVSVLPPPPGSFETRSPVMPVTFDLVLQNGTCLAVQRNTGAEVELEGLTCKPAQ